MSRWFRMYSEVLHDPKVQTLPPALFKTWVNLLCLAGQKDGDLPGLDEIAFALRLSRSAASKQLRELIERGLIHRDGDQFLVHNWDQRQFKSDRDDTAAERQRKKRERDRQQDVTRDTPVTVTRDITVESHPPDTDTETDAEIGGVGTRARDPLATLEVKLRKAAGWQSEAAPMLSVTGEVQALIDNGADLDLDVLPVVAALAPKCGSRTSWRYFLTAIARQRDQRIAASTIVSPPSNLNGGIHAAARQKPSRSAIFDAIHASIDRAERRSGPDGSSDARDPAEDAA